MRAGVGLLGWATTTLGDNTMNAAMRLGVLLLGAALIFDAAMAAEPAAIAASTAATVSDSTPLGSGPYKAILEVDPGLATHTIYHPADLSALGQIKLPIVAWANGACANAGDRFRWFLTDVASYGFLVIAIGPIGPAGTDEGPQPSRAPAVAAPATAAAPALPPSPTRSSQLIDAINWALAENSRAGSAYFHKLDTSKIAIMGQSCGGVQAIEASADPRVTTTVIWNSGLFQTPTTMAGGKPVGKEALALLHGPTAYISGDAQDVAYLNANDDFERLNAIPVLRAYERDVPHVGTYRERNGGEFAGIAVAWLQWQLQGDERAGRMFSGEYCGLCVNPRWVVRKKHLP
jgi:hypothetical protein